MLFYSFFSSCYAYFTVTNVDFTLSCGLLSSIHACFKTIYIDVMLFYSFSSRCYACFRMIYLLTSYCFMASGQVSIILMVPVHVERPCQAAKAHVQKVSNVSKKTPTEGGLCDSVIVHEMLVSCHIQALISGHSQPKYLITLTEKEGTDPHHMKQGVEIAPGYPRCTIDTLSNSIPHSFMVGTARFNIIDCSAIDVPENHKKQEKQVPKEVHVISDTYTILYPWTMVIKLGYTSITNRTML